MLNLQILTTKISSPEFIYTEIWKYKPLNKRKENSLAQPVLGPFLSVSALWSSSCNLQVLKVLPASVAVHLSILNIQFAASVPYTSFVIQVMHTNTYLWASPWYFQKKCPRLTLHCTRVLLQKPFFSLLSLTDTCLSLESFPSLTGRDEINCLHSWHRNMQSSMNETELHIHVSVILPQVRNGTSCKY